MKHKTVMKAFDVIEMVLILGTGFLLMKIMWGFSEGMNAWAELHRILQ
jgi:hypothetical protein